MCHNGAQNGALAGAAAAGWCFNGILRNDVLSVLQN
jgi:hypothetical protein